jgi:Protein of unknown function (DUF2442)
MDGRAISVPLAWYPRLAKATGAQLSRWEVAGGGYGIHWPEIDEGLSTEGLLRGARALGMSLKAGQAWCPALTAWFSPSLRAEGEAIQGRGAGSELLRSARNDGARRCSQRTKRRVMAKTPGGASRGPRTARRSCGG